jgi:hypothetical protein
MEPAPARPRHEAIDHDDQLVHKWRLALLTALGSHGRWPRPPACTLNNYSEP